MARMQRSLFAQLNALAEEISQNAEKVAAVKEAAPVPADPGGYQGASAHPSAHVDNNVQKATTGARAAEYEADIKKQQGAPAVDNTPEMSQEGRQDEVQLNINTNASAVGEDPSVENDYKGKKDDPPTTLPSAPQDSEKYSAVTFKEAHARCSALGNKILADIITVESSSKKAEAPVAAANDSAVKAAEMPEALKNHAEKKETKGELKGDQHEIDVDGDGKIEGADLASLRNDKEAAFAAGYELASALGVEKAAAEAAVRDVCANTLREADEMADLFIGFYTKKAESDPTEEATEGEDHEESESPEQEAAEEAGSAPADSADVAGLMGGAEAGLEAAPPSEDEALQELAMALQELGISPEALLAGIGGGAGGEAMGGDPMAAAGGDPMAAAGAGAVPPEMAPKMAASRELQTIGNAVVNFQRSGNFQVKEARTKRSRELRDIMKAHVRELVSR